MIAAASTPADLPCLCCKRLSAGKFAFWPAAGQPARVLQACELQLLLMGRDPAQARAAPAWRALSLAAQ